MEAGQDKAQGCATYKVLVRTFGRIIALLQTLVYSHHRSKRLGYVLGEFLYCVLVGGSCVDDAVFAAEANEERYELFPHRL